MTTIRFTVMGNPIPWARARMFGKRFFTEPRVTKAKKIIGIAARSAMRAAGAKPSKGNPDVTIMFYRKNRQRCDIDRLASLPLDAMNEIVYVDDLQVDGLTCRRFIDKENPRTEIWVSNV